MLQSPFSDGPPALSDFDAVKRARTDEASRSLSDLKIGTHRIVLPDTDAAESEQREGNVIRQAIKTALDKLINDGISPILLHVTLTPDTTQETCATLLKMRSVTRCRGSAEQ